MNMATKKDVFQEKLGAYAAANKRGKGAILDAVELVSGLWKYLYGKLIEVTKHYPKLYIKEANHDKDHIHLLISIPPRVTVGSVVRLVKTNTARNIKDRFPILKKYYWGTDSLWSEGYFVSTVGITTDTIKRYIAKQGELDTGQTASLFD